jgi:putative ABC transport system substrate-binding protein
MELTPGGDMWCRAVGCIVTLTLSLLAASLAIEAQSPRQVHRIGFLWNSSPALTRHSLEAFRRGLYEHGYVEGEHFTIESRYAEGNPERLSGLAAELVALQVAVIVTSGS